MHSCVCAYLCILHVYVCILYVCMYVRTYVCMYVCKAPESVGSDLAGSVVTKQRQIDVYRHVDVRHLLDVLRPEPEVVRQQAPSGGKERQRPEVERVPLDLE